jgi:hypothetical protein
MGDGIHCSRGYQPRPENGSGPRNVA